MGGLSNTTVWSTFCMNTASLTKIICYAIFSNVSFAITLKASYIIIRKGVTILIILLFLIQFHLPNINKRSHCSLLTHISSFARFILASMFICVSASLSFIFHLLLGLYYVLTTCFPYIFSHIPFLFLLFLIGYLNSRIVDNV